MCIGSGSLRALDEVLRGVSWEECNQIATVLGLPKTTPSPTSLRDESFGNQMRLTMDMPSGCVWQKATSQPLGAVWRIWG